MPRTLSKRYLETQQCELPDRLDEPVTEPWFDDADPASPKSPEPRESISARETCTMTMQAGPNKGQVCGKSVVKNGLCRRHAEQVAAKESGERPAKRPKIDAPTAGRCVCKTKKGEYCGAAVKGDALVCKRHAACPIPPEIAAQFAQPVTAQPLVVVDEPMDLDIDDPTVQRDQAEPVLIVPDTDPVPVQPVEPVEPVESQLFQQPEWGTVYVNTTADMVHILDHLVVVDIDEQQLQQLNNKIRACFE